MKRNLLVAFAILALATSHAEAQNLFSNPGFESPTTTTTAMGNWFRFNSTFAAASDSTTMPRTGQRHVSLETVGANQFAGVFQTLPVPVSPGQRIAFTGWHKTLTPPFNATVELKIEWQGAPQNRLDVLMLGTNYEQFNHTGVAPAGTTGATITYAISSFGAGQSGAAVVYIDDFSAILLGPGDYNLDGAVNAADYVVWRKTDGTTPSYNTWRANFRQTAGAGAISPVPEPATLLPLLVAACLMCARRRK